MSFSEKVLTKGRRSKTELRALDSRGTFVMCKYLNPETLKLADRKRKLSLRQESGEVHEFFIIPLKNSKRSLLIAADPEEQDRRVWNDRLKREEDYWQEP